MTSDLPADAGDGSAPRADPRDSLRWSAIFVAVCALAGVLVALLGGWLWVRFGNPPSVPLTRGGRVLLGEQGLNQETAATGWFMLVGLVLGAVAGIVVGLVGRRLGWVTVVGVLVLCAVASAGSGWLGHHVFSADPRDQAKTAKIGDMIHLGVQLGSNVAYLSWLVGGLAGVIAAMLTWPDEQKPSGVDLESSTVISRSS